MPDFRQLLDTLDERGELLRVTRSVEKEFELPALLKQAEQRRKAILFSAVAGSPYPVAGGLLTGGTRFATGLGKQPDGAYGEGEHRDDVAAALASSLPVSFVATGRCKDVIEAPADGVNCDQLPVPTCFAGDSGPFLTAAVGISRNPENGIVNAGIYRVLMLGGDRMAVSIGPGSDLLRFVNHNRDAGNPTEVAFVIGANPALLMAAAAKVPPTLSELDVAGALIGEPLQVVNCERLDLPVPADSEFVLETVITGDEQVPNTMGEFGDLYGGRDGPVAHAVALTHRRDPVFHTIMAGAGKEHNSIGMIVLYPVEPEVREQLAATHPEVTGLRVLFEPPTMGMTGEVWLQLRRGSATDAEELVRHVLGLRAGNYDLSRIVRKVVLVDDDVDLSRSADITWAINNRALTTDRFIFIDDLPLPGVGMRQGIDTRVREDEYETLQRLVIPGADTISLDDYLD